MDDDDRLDETLASLISAPPVATHRADAVFGRVVARARARIQRRRLTAAAAAMVIVIAIGLGAFAANARSRREVQVQSPTSSTGPATTVPRAAPTAKLGPCPQSVPSGAPGSSNMGITGLAARLVPIDATTVRICSYVEPKKGTPLVLDRFGQLTLTAATAFEKTNNGLRLPPRVDISRCPSGPGWLVTFANLKQQVTVGGYCGGVLSNGTFIISNSQQWFNEVDLALTTDCYPALSAANHSRPVCVPARGTIRGTLRLGAPKRIRPPNCPTDPGRDRALCLRGRIEFGPQLAGRIIITGTNGVRRSLTTTASQPFSVDLPLGMYRVTGTTANGSTCRPAGPLMVLEGCGFDLDLVCK